MTLPLITLSVLRSRAAFLEVAASGKKWVAPGLIVQFGKPYAQDNAALSLNTVFLFSNQSCKRFLPQNYFVHFEVLCLVVKRHELFRLVHEAQYSFLD